MVPGKGARCTIRKKVVYVRDDLARRSHGVGHMYMKALAERNFNSAAV